MFWNCVAGVVVAGILVLPNFALSRHQLRRLCMRRSVPCVAFPCGANRTRYMVRVRDLVSFLRNNEREQFGRCWA